MSVIKPLLPRRRTTAFFASEYLLTTAGHAFGAAVTAPRFPLLLLPCVNWSEIAVPFPAMASLFRSPTV